MPPAVEFLFLCHMCCGIGSLVFPLLILILVPCTFHYFIYITNIVIDFFGFGKLDGGFGEPIANWAKRRQP